MFALQIYRTLTGRALAGGRAIAGTGVLDADGTVQPIEGSRQKLRAALKAGAGVFILPAQNYKDLQPSRDVVIMPVQNFAQALRKLAALPPPDVTNQ
jgi:PDZ domain-containing protein